MGDLGKSETAAQDSQRTRIVLDGGVTKENARAVAACGVDIVVAGTAVFRGDIEENIHVLQEEINTEGQNAS